jgi:DsbC/DsbD-like thiol-disulfide interchange protein
MKLPVGIALIFLLLLPVAVLAQGASPAVTVAPPETLVINPGGEARLRLQMRIKPGMHINSAHPNDEMLLPTVAHFSPPQPVMIFNIMYPKDEQLVLPFLSEKLSVYSGEVQVDATVKVAADTVPGTMRVHGDVRYQACDNRQCFPPKLAPFEFDVKVERAKSKKSSYNVPNK